MPAWVDNSTKQPITISLQQRCLAMARHPFFVLSACVVVGLPVPGSCCPIWVKYGMIHAAETI